VLVCKNCQHEWEIEIPAFICGTCGPGAVEVKTGEEFMVESIEVEDEEDAACTAPR
jgi:Zn finger protein HypA/HybF involved in hydrogenase expression